MKISAILGSKGRKTLLKFRSKKSLTANQVEQFLEKHASKLRREVVLNLRDNPVLFRKFFPDINQPTKHPITKQGFFRLKYMPKRQRNRKYATAKGGANGGRNKA